MEWLNISSTYDLNIHTLNIQEHHLPLLKGLMKGSNHLTALTKLCVPSQPTCLQCPSAPCSFSEFFSSRQVLLGFHSVYINMLYCCCMLVSIVWWKFFWRWCTVKMMWRQSKLDALKVAQLHDTAPPTSTVHVSSPPQSCHYAQMVCMILWSSCNSPLSQIWLCWQHMVAYDCNLLDLLHELRVHSMNISASRSIEHAIVTCFIVFQHQIWNVQTHAGTDELGFTDALIFAWKLSTLLVVRFPIIMLHLLSGKFHPHFSTVGPVFFKILKKLLWCLLSKFCKSIIIAVSCPGTGSSTLLFFFFFFSFSWEIARLAILCFIDFSTWKRPIPGRPQHPAIAHGGLPFHWSLCQLWKASSVLLLSSALWTWRGRGGVFPGTRFLARHNPRLVRHHFHPWPS